MPLRRQAVVYALTLVTALFVGMAKASLLQPTTDLTPISLQLLWHHQFQSAGYYAAVEKGYYRDAGLQVEIRAGGYTAPGHGVDPVEEVIAGRADFGVSRSDLLILHSQGKPVVVVANVMQRSPLTFLTLARYGLERLEDIGERPVSLTLPTLETDSRVSAETLTSLQRAGIDYRTLNNSPPTWNLDDLLSGKTQLIPAYVTDTPYFVRQRGETPVEIAPADYGIDFYGETLFTSEQLLETHPDRVAAFREATLKGWRYAMANPEEIADLILTAYGTRSDEYDKAFLRYEAQRIAELMQPELIEIGYTNRQRWEDIAAIYQAQGLIDTYDLDAFLAAATPGTPRPRLAQLGHLTLPGILVAAVILLVIGYLYLTNCHLSVEVARRKSAERALRHQAERDGLTGLHNRCHFEMTYHQEVTRTRHERSALSLIVFDVDHFKQVNDTFGHLAGDRVLAEIARVTRSVLRDGDHFARYGGEEFTILLPDTALAEARDIAERILDINRQHTVCSESRPIRYTLSIGLAELVEGDAAPIDLLRRADRLLYRAKHTGRDALCC